LQGTRTIVEMLKDKRKVKVEVEAKKKDRSHYSFDKSQLQPNCLK